MFEMYKRVFQEGIDLQFGKLTLVDLSHYKCGHFRPGRYRYQIYCDDRRCCPKEGQPFTKLYYELQIDDAIKKFVEIKNKIKAGVR